MRLSIISKGNETKTVPDTTFEGDFSEFADLFKKYRPFKEKRDGYFTRGLLGGSRNNKNLKEAEILVLDGDQATDNENSAPDPEVLHRALKLIKLNHFIYTTHSYNPPEKIKWRCVIPCHMQNITQLKPTLHKLFTFLQSIDYPLVNVKENGTWSQPWYFPNRAEDDGKFLFFKYTDGADYQPADAEYESNTSVSEQSKTSHRGNLTAIETGVSYYKELQNVIFGFAKDGRSKTAALADVEMIMKASKASSSSHEYHEKWGVRFANLPTYIDQAYGAIKQDDSVCVEDLILEEQEQTFIELDYPPGLIGELCQNFYEMAPHPNKEISIMGGVCLVAGVVGRKYNVMGTGLNIYATLLADSGIGKAILKDGINLALRSADALNGDNFIGSSRFTGPKAVFDMLQDGLSRVCVLEESGLMNESKAGDQSGLNRVMLDLYTSSGARQWAGAEAYSSKENSIKPIQSPALSILNVSTPKSYLKAMKMKGAELSGEIARMWMIRSMSEKPYLNIQRKREFSGEVIGRLSKLISFCAGCQSPESIYEVRHVEYDTDLIIQDSNKFVDLENQYKKEGDHLRRTLCSRAFIKIMKLSAICSVFNGKGRIGEEEYAWARQTVEHEMIFIQDTFTHESSDDLLFLAKSVVAVAIVKCFQKKFKAKNKILADNLIKSGVITHSVLGQVLLNNSVLRELDDDPTKNNPKKGMEKVLDYMVRNGILRDFSKKELMILGSRASKAYMITDDFQNLVSNYSAS